MSNKQLLKIFGHKVLNIVNNCEDKDKFSEEAFNEIKNNIKDLLEVEAGITKSNIGKIIVSHSILYIIWLITTTINFLFFISGVTNPETYLMKGYGTLLTALLITVSLIGILCSIYNASYCGRIAVYFIKRKVTAKRKLELLDTESYNNGNGYASSYKYFTLICIDYTCNIKAKYLNMVRMKGEK